MKAKTAKTLPAQLRTLLGSIFEGPSPHTYPPCIYFLLWRGRVVYVGQTISLAARVSAHASEGKRFDRVVYLPCDAGVLDTVERRCICHLRPRYNRSLYPGASDANRFTLKQDLMLGGGVAIHCDATELEEALKVLDESQQGEKLR